MKPLYYVCTYAVSFLHRKVRN